MDAKFWKQALRKAERELDAATRLSDVNAAAKRLMRAKAELKRLEGMAAEHGRRREGFSYLQGKPCDAAMAYGMPMA